MNIAVALFILIFAVAIVIGLIPLVASAFGDKETARKVEKKIRENRYCYHCEDEDDWITSNIGRRFVDGIGEPLWRKD